MAILPETRESQEQLHKTHVCTVVVGDMAGRGVMTFELREAKTNKVKIIESASTHISMWVNSIVPMSPNRFMVFDQDGNLYIFEKTLLPTTIDQRFKLKLIGSYCAGGEVKSAAFGSLRVIKGARVFSEQNRDLGEEENLYETKVKEKRKNYLKELEIIRQTAKDHPQED